MKKNSITFLLIVLTALLNLSYKNAYGQEKNKYLFDSTEVREIVRIILENEYLQEQLRNYILKDSNSTAEKTVLIKEIELLKQINRIKDMQIQKFELPQTVINNSWQWYQWTLAAVGTLATGFAIGIIYSNSK